MKCRDDISILCLQGIKYFDGFSRSFNNDINPACSDIFSCLLRYRHHTRIPGSYDEALRAGIESVHNIFRMKSMPFFSPPRCIHSVVINNNIRRIGTRVDYNLTE